MMRAGDRANGAVFGSNVVDHPNGVANPIAVVVGDGGHVGMERLRFGPMRIDGADVETAEFELVSKDVADVRQHSRMGNDLLEDVAFINQVGEAATAGFLFEFGAGVVAFGGEDLLNAAAE